MQKVDGETVNLSFYNDFRHLKNMHKQKLVFYSNLTKRYKKVDTNHLFVVM